MGEAAVSCTDRKPTGSCREDLSDKLKRTTLRVLNSFRREKEFGSGSYWNLLDACVPEIIAYWSESVLRRKKIIVNATWTRYTWDEQDRVWQAMNCGPTPRLWSYWRPSKESNTILPTACINGRDGRNNKATLLGRRNSCGGQRVWNRLHRDYDAWMLAVCDILNMPCNIIPISATTLSS